MFTFHQQGYGGTGQKVNQIIRMVVRLAQYLTGLELYRHANLMHQRLILGGELKDEAVLKKIHGKHPRVVRFNDRICGE